MLELLLRLRSRIEMGWCQGWGWRDADGTETHFPEDVVSTCLLGGIAYVSPNYAADPGIKNLLARFFAGNPVMLMVYNDEAGRTQEDILRLIDAGILLHCLEHVRDKITLG